MKQLDTYLEQVGTYVEELERVKNHARFLAQAVIDGDATADAAADLLLRCWRAENVEPGQEDDR